MGYNRKNLFSDPSLWFLLVSNFVTIFFAVKDGWSLLAIMWVYWFQSITIGFFNFIRILQLEDSSEVGFKFKSQSMQSAQKKGKIFIAFFFLVHYGLFHIAYLAFLNAGAFVEAVDAVDMQPIFLTAALFFINHLFSFIYNKSRDTKKQKADALLFYPYARIIPMHLTIIFGSFFGAAVLPFFLLLKTFSDALMHVVGHKVIRKGEKTQNTQEAV